MEDFFLYLVKSCLLLAVFFLVFKLLLSKETFFEAHRLFLVGGIFTALLLPFVILKKIVWVEAPQFQNIDFNTIAYNEVITPEETDWWQLAGIIYIIGVVFFSIRFIIQLFSLYRLFKKSTITKKGEFTFALTTDTVSPFSFFNILFYNPKMHTEEELKAILIHEQIHAKQQHSLDILLVHGLTIFQWMNPFSWMYKKTMAQNLEYIADKYSANTLADKKAYQYLLLHQSGQVAPKTDLINPFFNSLIKKRIVMLNQKPSNPIHVVKYGLILPLLGVFLFAFNTETIAQEKERETNENKWTYEIRETRFEVLVDKNSTDEELERDRKALEENGIALKFSKIKRNNIGEIIKIKSTYTTKDGKSGAYSVSDDEPITPFSLVINLDKSGGLNDMGYKSASKEHSFILFSPDSETINISTSDSILKFNSAKSFVIRTSQSEEFDVDDFPSDSLLNAIDIRHIKKVEVLKNEDGKTGRISISKKNFIDPNKVAQIELPASSKSFNWNDIHQEEKPLIVVDGEVTENSILKSLNPDTIESLSVLKDKSATAVYGDKGKNGVIIITTKKTKNKTGFLENTSDKALYIIDGKMIKGNPQSIGLKPNEIASVMVLKDKSATELYGDKGKNGVIQIITKKAQKNKDKTQNSLEKALFVVDGEITSDINNIQPSNINVMNVLKGEAAIKKYGANGANGVIEIETKNEIKIIGYGTKNESTTKVSDLNSKTAENFYVEAKKISKDGKTYISGKVFTSDTVLPGVTIIIENSKSGTITNFDGQFTIAAEDGQKLLFQFVGFPNAELKITENQNYSISTSKK